MAVAWLTLQLLHVAVTRARSRVIFFDSSPASEPLRMLWQVHNLVEVYTAAGLALLPRVTTAESTAEDWIAQGVRTACV